MDTRVMRGDSRARVFLHLASNREANFRWTSGGEDVESSEFASSF